MARLRPAVPRRNPFAPYEGPRISRDPKEGEDNFRPVRARQVQPKRTITLTGAQGNVPLCYGRQRLGGEILFAHQQSAFVLWLVVGLSRGEVDSLTSLTVNDKPAASYSSAVLQYWFHRGESGQTADANLAAALPGWNEALTGICYAVVRLGLHRSAWSSLPPQMRWEFKGLKCYDLSNLAGAKVYSENLWVQDYDYMRHADGKALPEAAVHTADWVAAAAVANEAMSDATKRYEYHPLVSDDLSVDDALQQFCIAGDGYRYTDGEKFRLFLDRPAASTATLTDGELLRQRYSIERDDPFAKPNHVVVEFTDEADGWNDKPLAEEQKTAAAASGAEDLITVTYNLPGIHRRSQARRKAIFFLNNLVFDARLRRTERATGVSLLPGAVVTVDLKAKGIVQNFRVIPVTKNPDHTYEVDLLEYNTARYSDTVVTDTSRIKSTFPDPFATPPWPGLVAVTAKSTEDGAQVTTWGMIPVRSSGVWGAAFWSQVNCGGVTLANLNDGDYTTKALDFNVAGESIVKLDLGLGNTRTFREAIVSSTSGAGWFIEYSDDGAAWTAVRVDSYSGFGTGWLVNETGAKPDVSFTRVVCAWAAAGAHRYWRLRQNSTAATAGDFAEIQFYEWTGEWPFIDSVVLCAEGDDPSTGLVASEVPSVKSIATQGLGAFALSGLNDSGYNASWSSQLHTLSQAGNLSWGVAKSGAVAVMAYTSGWAPDYLLHGQYALSLSNGANNDKAVPSTVTLLRVTGPTAAFSLSGLVARDGANNTGEGGRAFVIANASGQIMTLTHDATSTAANRLFCSGLADLVVPDGHRCIVIYDSTASRWLVFQQPPIILRGSATWDPANVPAGDSVSTTITVTGAAVGDTVVVNSSLNPTHSNYSCVLTANVTSANTVTVNMVNAYTAARNLGSSTIYVMVLK